MRRTKVSWKGLIYYGEVFGFLLAWLVVFAVANQSQTAPAEQGAIDRVAAVDSPSR